MTADTWTRIRDHLLATGRLTGRGSSRAAKPRLCTRCNAPVVIALDADLCALDATADPTPLDAAGELLALATGRSTYTLAKRGGRHELDYRDGLRIRSRPPGGRWDVVPEHVCGRPLPSVPAATAAAVAVEIPQECPF